jgi:hypothetical protein
MDMSDWLAVGDETGNWDELKNPGAFLGVALVVGRIEDWQAALQETIGGQRVKDRLQAPIRHLPPANRRSQTHHLKDAFDYWERQRLGGEWLLAEPDGDPSRQEVFATLRWLAEHPHLITLGLWGRGATLKPVLFRSDDPAVALGQAYGLLVGQVLPFLNVEDRLLVQPGLRSEPADSPARQRATITKNPNNDDARLHGHTRGTVSVLIDEGQRYRQAWHGGAIAGFDAGVLVHLRKQYPSLGSVWLPNDVLNAIADLGAGLLRLSCQTGATQLGLRREPSWTNVVLHSLEEITT